MAFKVYIPARYDSSRLPGKLLLEAGGQTILERVYRNACESGASEVVVATDHVEIAAHARDFGAEGIGLCRTEHMFFEGDRITAMREMILAEEEPARRKALKKLLLATRQELSTSQQELASFQHELVTAHQQVAEPHVWQ